MHALLQPPHSNAALFSLMLGMASLAPAAHAGHFAQVTTTAYVCADPLTCSPILSNWPYWQSAGSSMYYSPGMPANLSAQISNGGVFESFSLSSSGSADLGTGSLKAAARIDNAEATQGRTAMASSQAWIGDSFSFATGQGSPFNWGSSDTVTLNIHLDGQLINTTTDNNPARYGLQFAVRQYGAIQSTQGVPLDAVGNFAWSMVYQGGGPIGYSPSSYGALPITYTVTGDPTQGGLNLQLTFQPGGDFDWDLVLYTDAMITDLSGSKVADFSHTLTADFVAPAGAVVTSSSGVFPVTAAVPEPAQWLALALGLPLLAWRTRRSARNRA